MNRRWLSTLLLLGVTLGFGSRLDDMALRDSMMAKGSLMGHRWLEKNGLEDYLLRQSCKPVQDSGLTCRGRWSYGPSLKVSLRVTADDTVICLTRGSGASLIRFRAQDSVTLDLLGDLNFAGIPRRAILSDTLVVAGIHSGGTGLEVHGVSNPAQPNLLSRVDLPVVNDIAVKDSLVYVACEDDTLRIYSIANPRLPVLVGSCRDSCDLFMAQEGNYCYLVHVSGVNIVDVSDPANPHRAGHIGGGEPLATFVRDTLCYVTVYLYGLRVWDISDVASPALTGSLSRPDAMDLTMAATNDTMLYTALLDVINVANPAIPVLAGHVDIPADDEYGVAVVPATDYALVANYTDGVVAVDIRNPASPSVETTAFGAGSTTDICVDGAKAYLASPLNGMSILNVSDPTRPTRLGRLDIVGLAPECRSVVARDSFAYVHWYRRPQFQSVDVSDPTRPTLAGGADVTNPPEDMVIRDSFVYMAEVNRFQIVNVARPREPVLVGSCVAGDLTRAGLVVRDTLAYFIGPFDGLEVFDVADPTTPHLVNTVARIRAAGCDVVDTLLYVGDYDDSLHIWSFANPLAPYQLSSVYAVRSGYGVAVLGRYAYVGCDSRVRVFDVLDTRNPVEVGSCATPYEIRRVEAANGYVYVCCWEAGVSIFDTFQTGIEDRPRPSFQSPALVVSSPVAGNAVSLEFRATPGSEARVAITDAVGRVLLRDRPVVVPGSGIYRYRMDVGSLPAGVYIINVRVGPETRLTRFVKLKRR